MEAEAAGSKSSAQLPIKEPIIAVLDISNSDSDEAEEKKEKENHEITVVPIEVNPVENVEEKVVEELKPKAAKRKISESERPRLVPKIAKF